MEVESELEETSVTPQLPTAIFFSAERCLASTSLKLLLMKRLCRGHSVCSLVEFSECLTSVLEQYNEEVFEGSGSRWWRHVTVSLQCDS